MSPTLRRVIAGLSGLALAAAGLIVAPTAHAASTDLVINEVYARGGSANQPYRTKFVELYNASDAAIDLGGYGLAYSSAGNAGLGQTCALTGTIAAKGFRTIGVGSNGSTGADVATQQTCTNINPSGTAGAYTLVQGSTTVDLVGWGSALRVETAAASYPGGNSNPGSIARTADGVDTDVNATDFAFVAQPTPGASNSGGTGPDPDPEPDATTIAEIQGTGAASPLVGREVTTTAVVTAAYPTGGFRGVYLQTPGSGGVPKAAGEASDGIFAFSDWAAETWPSVTASP